jgi:NADPH-dependent 2,4-dienoyl-CoA reductase/sulfur reductase-like enzyme
VESAVVVGAGIAGTYAVAGLRRRGYTGRLTLVGAEPHRPYDRPPLSKQMLAGAAPTSLEDDLDAVLEDLCDDVRLGSPVADLQVTGDEVRLSAGGEQLHADVVLLACGAQPVLPAGWGPVLTLRTLDDATRLRDRLTPGTRLVIAGAGWIGAEVAGAAAAAGCDVTVVEALPAPLAREVGVAVGDLTRPWHDAAGVRLRTGRRVVSASPGGVLLDDGERLPADVVLAAVGVAPDVGWLRDADGLDVDPRGGVRVGADLRAIGPLHPHVVAAGDCALRWSPRYERWLPGGHWEEAMLAGDAAAAALLGEPVTHDPPPYVFSTQFGRELALVGRPDADADVVLRGDPTAADGWSAAWVRRDPNGARLVALFSVDRPRDLAQARRALTAAPGAGAPVDAQALADPESPVKSAVLR